MRKSKKKKVIDATNSLDPPHNAGFANRKQLKPKTENQANLIKTIHENIITFAEGLPGTGKTACAVGLALEHLLEDKVKKIIITRPVLEAGEKIGFIPGSFEEKLNPYLLPIYDEISNFITISHFASLKTAGKIEIVPFGFMRGRNFHNAFIVADECQNASYDQLKMLLTRIGMNSKMVLTGDVKQSDLPRHQQGGFLRFMDALEGLEGIGIAELTSVDIIRNPIIGKILDRLEELEENEDKK